MIAKLSITFKNAVKHAHG